LIDVPEGIMIAGFGLTLAVGLNGVYYLFDAKKKLTRIDEFVWSLKQ
jgi:hypothetical protein